MATYTSTQEGSWNDVNTWGGGGLMSIGGKNRNTDLAPVVLEDI